MADKNFVPSAKDFELITRALELLRQSYQRAQKQRPEFATISKQYESDITALIAKLS